LQFRGPSGLAVDSSGNIYVTECFGQRFRRFSASGGSKKVFGTLGTGDGQFQFPLGIILSGGKVFVSDAVGNRVQRFTTAGAYDNLQWGTSGSGTSQFEGSIGMAVASSGDIYVADQGNHRVQYFSSVGAPKGEFGDATLQSPWGVAVSGSQVFVSDDHLGKVLVYGLTGTAAGSWGAQGSVYGQFANRD